MKYYHNSPPPPPTFSAGIVAVLMSAALAVPASAQVDLDRAARVSQVSDPSATYATRLNQNLVWPAPMVNNRTLSGAVNNLTIEAMDSAGGMTHDRTTFGVGPGSHCAHSAGRSGGVEFHNPTGTYSRGGAIAIACRTYTTPKCSRSVTFMGRTFTANRGYPRCTGPTEPLTGEYTGRNPRQQTGDIPADFPENTRFTPTSTPAPIARTPSRGIFRVRVWGKVCHAATSNAQRCWNLKNPTPPPAFPVLANAAGYGATFRTARHCGPPSWPTPELQAAGAPAYAKWCDVTVDVRFP